MRIARDHGKFYHEAGALPHLALVPYEAVYRVENEEAKEAQRKIDSQNRSK